jgi:hypothetical protein
MELRMHHFEASSVYEDDSMTTSPIVKIDRLARVRVP